MATNYLYKCNVPSIGLLIHLHIVKLIQTENLIETKTMILFCVFTFVWNKTEEWVSGRNRFFPNKAAEFELRQLWLSPRLRHQSVQKWPVSPRQTVSVWFLSRGHAWIYFPLQPVTDTWKVVPCHLTEFFISSKYEPTKLNVHLFIGYNYKYLWWSGIPDMTPKLE